MKRSKRILLCVDMEENDPGNVRLVWKALKPALDRGAFVQPVTILDRNDFAVGSYLKSRIGRLRPATESHLSDTLLKMGLKNLGPAKALLADGSSKRRAVEALIRYAKQGRFDLIALATHSRQGLNRLVLGSFAETLCLSSPIPLLVVNPRHQNPPSKVRTVLFPTDFSESSRAGLGALCAQLGKERPKILLYHRYSDITLAQMGPFGAFPIPASVLEDGAKQVASLGKRWKEELERKGYPCEFLLDRKSLSLTDGVLRAAKNRKADRVVMVSTKGRAGAFFLGSLSRQIARLSSCPVWVLQPGRATSKPQSRTYSPYRTAGPELRL